MKQPKAERDQLFKQVIVLQQLVRKLRKQGIEVTIVKKATFLTCH